MMGAGLVALAGFSALAAPGFFTSNRNEGKVTLRSRILDYEESIKKIKPFPRTESIEADVIAMMGEYFRIGMSYDECMKILVENDLNVDEKYTNERDSRFPEQRIYFNPSIVSVINIPTLKIFISFEYRIILRFQNSKLQEYTSSRVGSGP